MPAKPQYIHDMITSVKVLEEQVANLRRESNDLGKKAENSKESVEAIRKDVAVIDQQLKEIIKRIEKWEGRWWGIVVIAFGALLSLASGLIVTLVRK